MECIVGLITMTESMKPRIFFAILITWIMVQGVIAVAPRDAPPLVIEPPSGNIGVMETRTTVASSLTVPVLPEFPLWMAFLGIVLIATAAGGLYLVRRPKTYVPRSKRLQK